MVDMVSRDFLSGSLMPEIFQRTLTELFEGIDGVVTSQEDILVAGRNMTEDDERQKI